MKSIISDLNKAFDHKVRLGIMSVLIARDDADFNTLKEILQVTDGNLASHVKAQQKESYSEEFNHLRGRKPNPGIGQPPKAKMPLKNTLMHWNC